MFAHPSHFQFAPTGVHSPILPLGKPTLATAMEREKSFLPLPPLSLYKGYSSPIALTNLGATRYNAGMHGNVLAENRRARFDYEITETFEGGIELLGHEVASAKRGHMELTGSYAIIRGGEAWLVNLKIAPYQPKNIRGEHDPSRPRRLLLHKVELKELSGKLDSKSWSLLPLRAYLKKGIIKLELGLGRPKKTRDKRDTIKKRDVERDIQRKL